MININFFEKKETNILPYLVGGGFFLLLILMSIYFFFARMYLKDSASDKEAWFETNAEEIVLSERMNQLEEQYNETMELQEKLKLAQYPMHKVAIEIAAAVPDELTRISSFQILEPSQLTLTLENTEAIMANKIVQDIENLPYVTGSQLLHVESQGEEDAQLRFELIISLDEELTVKGETE